jgi:hypothetical protein
MRFVLKFVLTWMLAMAAMAATGAAAAPVGAIDSLQMPAWLDRGGLTVAASPGITLQPGDTVRTGRGARMLLRLDEGSVIKLGENAVFVIEAAARKDKLFDAALSVITGAFRFTTQAALRGQARNVRIKVGNNATVGIRGTDLWGRGRDDKDIVCLIEGKIDVTGNDSQTRRLDQPLQFFQSTRNAPPEPVTFLDRKQLDEWAKETELDPGKGAVGKGTWKVLVGGFASRDAQRSTRRLLRNAGYPAEFQGDRALFVAGLVTEADAEALAARLAAEFGLKDVRAGK